MIFLAFGVNESNQLVHIDSAPRGRTSIKCPYCAAPLLAKKGAINRPHFAHDGPTCAAAIRYNAALPAFDKFDLHLPAQVLSDLKIFSRSPAQGPRYGRLREQGLIRTNEKGLFELTNKGKIPLGQLSLTPFLDYQQAAFAEKHEALEQAAHALRLAAQADESIVPELETAQTDLRLYRAQWRRLLLSSLYFIEVTHADGVLYKIGVTMREITARMAEIEQDLRPHLGTVSLKVLDLWPYRGSVEFYFKHRYRGHQYRLGTLTEYFDFIDVTRILTHDLRQMPTRTLSPFEEDLCADVGAGDEVSHQSTKSSTNLQ